MSHEPTELELNRTLRHIVELAEDDQVSVGRRLNMIRVAIEKLWPAS
jgi:hypothetical protein